MNWNKNLRQGQYALAAGLLCALMGWSSLALAAKPSPMQPSSTSSSAAITPAAPLPFVVKQIKVTGLQRLPASRVYGLLPIHVGDKVNQADISGAIEALFQSGDFEDIRMLRDGSTLLISVSERPSIYKVEIEGNKSISTDDLRKGLKAADLLEGDVYKRSTLSSITGELERQYVAQGRYAAHVETDVTPLPRNRVKLTIKVYEGDAARIKNINIVGNHKYSDEVLLEQMKLKASHFFSFFTGDDKYSRERLSGDLETLRSWYLDRGYIRYNVKSVQVSVTPDHEHVFITINISEGDRYSVGKVSLEGDLPINRDQLEPLLIMKKGQVYSQQIQTYTSDLLTRRLGNAGYTFAEVKGHPVIHDDDHTVDVTFLVKPGKRVYVNNIAFKGNHKTADKVLRREMRQFESAPANTALINLSKSRLMRLGFFSKVDANTDVVPGTDDLVNVTYDVDEQPSGSIGANVGYSDANGIIFGASISQNNFMGSGNRVSFSLRRSEISERYSFSHYNPYYTPDGVSRGFSLHYSKINYDNARVDIARYAADRMGGAVTYGYPVSEYSRINFGYSLERIDVHSGNFVPWSIYHFLQREGDRYNEFSLNLGLSTSTLNSGRMPDRGWSQNTSLEIATPLGTYSYAKLTVNAQRYFPIHGHWVLRTSLKAGIGMGYGNDEDADGKLPFFENYYSGGVGSIRNYRAYSLGPRSQSWAYVQAGVTDYNPDPVGGNAVTELSAELIFPTPFAPDSRSVRTFLYFDAGNVFQLGNRPAYTYYPDGLRYSAGIGLAWLTAIGPLSFNIGRALNPEDMDDTEVFQFSLGRMF